MIDILSQKEGIPAAYPTITGLSDKAMELDQRAIWQRSEAYIAYRWRAREVVWLLEGAEGDNFALPLTPIISLTAEKWENPAWVSVTLAEGPLGYCLTSDGTYRITAQVGDTGAVPAAVEEAFRRLAEYSREISQDSMVTGHPSHQSHSYSLDTIQESFSRQATWAARAIQNSGAGDLLRPYRRV